MAVSGAVGLSRLKTGAPVRYMMLERVLDTADLESLTMQQVNGLLARLHMMDAPEPVMGAMCYEAMAYPSVAEYICPVCGEKTVYEDYNTSFIEWELQGCRRLVESIDRLTAFPVSLDETMFCSHCTHERDSDPELLLRVESTDSTTTVNQISIHDLRLLDSFLQGRLYYLTENDSQMPLKEYEGRIRELLGVPESQ